ncbi:M48 family metalloprotease [Glycomyces sp. NPDC021274]|uniref:M48 family metalloprotease n=1 Tax=Glycomyces sp. NPDC021274 TaxID=3155120 RepID=UPI0033CE997F
MIALALTLVAYALTTLAAAPLLVGRGRWRVHRPGLALAVWFAMFFSGLTAAVGSLAAAVAAALDQVLAAHRDSDSLMGLLAVIALCWLGFGPLGAVLFVVTERTRPILLRERATREELTELVRRLRYRTERFGDLTVGFLRYERAFACTLQGPDLDVLVSSRAASALTRAELAAVVEHERAHVDLRHGLVLRLAEVNAACLPRVRAAAEMMRSSALLVELVADDVAARRCGAAVAGALRTLGTLEDDESMLLRAKRLEQQHGAARRAVVSR